MRAAGEGARAVYEERVESRRKRVERKWRMDHAMLGKDTNTLWSLITSAADSANIIFDPLKAATPMAKAAPGTSAKPSAAQTKLHTAGLLPSYEGP